MATYLAISPANRKSPFRGFKFSKFSVNRFGDNCPKPLFIIPLPSLLHFALPDDLSTAS
jgi:hypothetical protein